MQADAASLSSPHLSGNPHVGGDVQSNEDNFNDSPAQAAAAAEKIFREFVCQSALVLSALFELEQEQLELAASAQQAASDQRTPKAATLPVGREEGRPAGRLPVTAAPAPQHVSHEERLHAFTSSSPSRPPWPPTQSSRPHIMLGYIPSDDKTSSSVVCAMLSDAATRWAPPELTTIGAPTQSATTTAATSLLAIFDAYIFPAELFSGRGQRSTPSTVPEAVQDEARRGRPSASREEVAMEEDGSAGPGSIGGVNAREVALRRLFRDLLILGQRCAVFALTYRGIIGSRASGNDNVDMDEPRLGRWLAPSCSPQTNLEGEPAGDVLKVRSAKRGAATSSSDDVRASCISRGGGDVDDDEEEAPSAASARQRTASTALQFLLQLACSCPCASLAYAAQLCLASALAIEPLPRSTAGWLARRQLLRHFEKIPSKPVTDLQDKRRASEGRMPAMGEGSSVAAAASASPARAGDSSDRAQHHAAARSRRSSAFAWLPEWPEEAALLWFDGCGAAHRQTGQNIGSLAGCEAYCGPLPATTALPTLQRVMLWRGERVCLDGYAFTGHPSLLEMACSEADPRPSSVGDRFSAARTPVAIDRAKDAGAATGDGSETSVTPSSADNTATLVNRGVAPGRVSGPSRQRRAQFAALQHTHVLPSVRDLARSNRVLHDVFTSGGECPSYYKLVSLYPEVLRAHHAALHYALFEDGPLPVDERLMVAIMAASRHHCEHLVSRFSALLLFYAECALGEEEGAARGHGGGDGEPPAELHSGSGQGQQHVFYGRQEPGDRQGAGGGPGVADRASPSFETSHGDNRAAMRCARGRSREHWIKYGPPERLRAVRHFIALAAHTPWTLSDVDIRNVLEHGWTIPEVFQLVAIVAQVLPLCGFVQGLCVPVEPWTMTLLPSDVIEGLRDYTVTTDNPTRGGDGGAPEAPPGSTDLYRRYAGHDAVVSEQRIRGGNTAVTPLTVWRSQFTWDELGAMWMEQYYPGAAALLREEIQCFADVVRERTEADCLGLAKATSTPFYVFRSIQLYVQNLVGFMVEDYAYNGINAVLHRSAKAFAQALTMRPETLTSNDVAECCEALRTQAIVSAEENARKSSKDGARGGRGGHASDSGDARSAPLSAAATFTMAEPPSDTEEVVALNALWDLQAERTLVLTALATMIARTEGLLHILLRPVCAVLSNM